MTEHKYIAKERDFVMRRWTNAAQENQIVIAPVFLLLAFILLAVGDTSVLTRVVTLVLQIVLF